MARIGDCYYPDGLPRGTSAHLTKFEFTDQDGQVFWIVYTKEQIDVYMAAGEVFAPYMPLFMSSCKPKKPSWMYESRHPEKLSWRFYAVVIALSWLAGWFFATLLLNVLR
jgi:hypothetical protein